MRAEENLIIIKQFNLEIKLANFSSQFFLNLETAKYDVKSHIKCLEIIINLISSIKH